MGLFDFFRRSSAKIPADTVALRTQITSQGLLLNFNAGVATIDLDALLEVDESASTKCCVDKALGVDILGSRPSGLG